MNLLVKRNPDANGFAVGDDVTVMDPFSFQIRRGTITHPQVQGGYFVRLYDGKEIYVFPPYIRKTEDVPPPRLF